jgi:hypothetical protein
MAATDVSLLRVCGGPEFGCRCQRGHDHRGNERANRQARLGPAKLRETHHPLFRFVRTGEDLESLTALLLDT